MDCNDDIIKMDLGTIVNQYRQYLDKL